MSLLYKHLRIHQIFGANTDVGKTIFTTALVRASAMQGKAAFYLKPISTGSVSDADDVHIKRFSGKHASGIVTSECLFRYDRPVSPHLAAQFESKVSDQALIDTIASRIGSYATDTTKQGHLFVETAGGVHTPTVSGSSQLDAYRPLFLPTILIGDSKLGGISATISAYESLLLRGYVVDSVLLFKDEYYRNWEYLTSYFAERDVSVASVDSPPARRPAYGADEFYTEQYYKYLVESKEGIPQVVRHLCDKHEKRLQELESMPSRTLSHVWWPFVQHGLAQSVTVIDSANTDFFSVHNGEGSDGEPSLTGVKSLLDLRFDASASWWTQALGHSHPSLTLAAARAAGRYGHVMFPQATHLPALNLTETLLSSKGPGHGWANRVFFSDDGSTGMEVALKMALRAYSKKFGVPDGKKKSLGVLGLKGSYHGDTIGAMNACESGDGVFTCEWHDAKGFWFDPPTLAICQGQVVLSLPNAIADIIETEGDAELLTGFSRDGSRGGTIGMGPTLSQAYDVSKRIQSKLAEIYMAYVKSVLTKLDESGVQLAALVLEPLLMGSGGMIFVDPLFQRVMVDVVRSREGQHSSVPGSNTWTGMPVIFDEVFVGMYRLGHLSTSSIIGAYPDISVHAKMLTGGLVPLSVTLARESIFEAFLGDNKDQALLHGHSYTAYPIGCEVANEALKQMDKLVDGPEWIQAQEKWGKGKMNASGVEEERVPDIWSFWEPRFVDMLSRLDVVAETMTLGTVLAIKVNDKDCGYRSDAARQVFKSIEASTRDAQNPQSSPAFGIHYRTLGDVAYLMTSLNTDAQTIRRVEKKILSALILQQE